MLPTAVTGITVSGDAFLHDVWLRFAFDQVPPTPLRDGFVGRTTPL
ncbi:hypothetical protein [Nocardia brevicatena]|nr:hypothetical protein [Nocardia brevicatena]